jgi:hypothetical protein
MKMYSLFDRELLKIISRDFKTYFPGINLRKDVSVFHSGGKFYSVHIYNGEQLSVFDVSASNRTDARGKGLNAFANMFGKELGE